MRRHSGAFRSRAISGVRLTGLGFQLQRVEYRGFIQFLCQCKGASGILPRRPVARGCVLTSRLRLAPYHPVGIEGDPGVGGTHVYIHFGGCGASLSFRLGCASVKWQFLCGGLLAVSAFLGVLLTDDTVPVDDLRLALEVIQASLLYFWVSHSSRSQNNMPRNIGPAKSCTVGHPHVDIPDEGAGQVAHLAKASAKEVSGHMVLPEL